MSPESIREETVVMPTPQTNRRAKIRVDFQTRIAIEVLEPAVRCDGDSKNLSLKGIFVETPIDVPIKARCRVQIFLSGTEPPVSFQLEGAVARKEPSGFAIAFDPMELESYTELKNIVRYNTEDPDDVY